LGLKKQHRGEVGQSTGTAHSLSGPMERSSTGISQKKRVPWDRKMSERRTRNRRTGRGGETDFVSRPRGGGWGGGKRQKGKREGNKQFNLASLESGKLGPRRFA